MSSDDDDMFSQTLRAGCSDEEIRECLPGAFREDHTTDSYAGTTSCDVNSFLFEGVRVRLKDADFCRKRNRNHWEPHMEKLCVDQTCGTVWRTSGNFVYVRFETATDAVNDVCIGATMHKSCFVAVDASGHSSTECKTDLEEAERLVLVDPHTAVTFLTGLLGDIPEEHVTKVLELRSEAYANSGDAAKALEDAQTALSETNQSSAKAAVCAAKAHKLLGHEDAARTHLEMAMTIDAHCEDVVVALQEFGISTDE